MHLDTGRSLAIFLILAFSLSAQDEALDPVFGGGAGSVVFDAGASERAYAVAVDSSGNLYVGGTQDSNDFLLLKYDSSGTLLWSRILTQGDGEFTTLAVDDATGDIYAAGSYDGGWEMYVLKFDSAGNLYGDDDPLNPVGATPFGNTEWIGGTVEDRFVYSNSYSYVTGMVRDPATGDLFLTGWEDDGGGTVYVLTMKLDLHGHRYGDSSSPDVDLTPFGNAEYDGGSNGVNDAADFSFSGTDSGNAIARDPVTGALYVAGSFGGDPLILKYDSDGGYVEPYGNFDYSGNATSDALDIPFAGNLLAIAIDASGNTVVAGVYSAGANEDYFVQKYDSTGTLLQPFGNFDTDGDLVNDAIVVDSGISNDRTHGIALDDAGDFLVVTGTFATAVGTEIRTQKYALSTGALLHTLSYAPVGFSAEGRAIALGSFFIAGFEQNGVDEDIRLIKYTSAPPTPPGGTPVPDDDDDGRCGLLGIEVLVLALLAWRRWIR